MTAEMTAGYIMIIWLVENDGRDDGWLNCDFLVDLQRNKYNIMPMHKLIATH